MARKKLNLNIADVENRERRLGTIVTWNGTASNLVKSSDYESRGNGERKKCGSQKGCKLCKDAGPFTQGTSCSGSMVDCQAGMIVDAVLIQHSPIGCSVVHTAMNSGYRLGCARRGHPIENVKTICTNLLEKDMVFGATAKLKQSIKDAYERFTPKAIFLATSCSTAIIGEDVVSIASEAENQLGIPVIPLSCEGFRAEHWTTGFDVVQHGILRQLVKKNPIKQEDLVNVITLFGTDVFTPIFKELNLRVNFAIDLTTVESLASLSEAATTITFCYTLSSYLAAGLEQQFGVPEIKAPQPYGLSGTDAWLREIARVTNRVELAEAYIEKEHKRVTPIIENFRKKFKGIKGYIATGSAYAHGLITVLRELGIEVNGSMAFHHDPVYDSGDTKQDSLRTLVEGTGDIASYFVGNRQQFQFYSLLKNEKPDFIFIRHNGLAPLAAKLGVPSICISDENSSIGYQGILNIAETIITVLQRSKFNQILKNHSTLPYTDWWLEQDDPLILTKHPELLDNLKKEKKEWQKVLV
ncbi:MAG: nitrogenase component 1 [Bacillota bacterium]|nr:nitrogenase component 1 [Bacillota bacterium]